MLEFEMNLAPMFLKWIFHDFGMSKKPMSDCLILLKGFKHRLVAWFSNLEKFWMTFPKTWIFQVPQKFCHKKPYLFLGSDLYLEDPRYKSHLTSGFVRRLKSFPPHFYAANDAAMTIRKYIEAMTSPEKQVGIHWGVGRWTKKPLKIGSFLKGKGGFSPTTLVSGGEHVSFYGSVRTPTKIYKKWTPSSYNSTSGSQSHIYFRPLI